MQLIDLMKFIDIPSQIKNTVIFVATGWRHSIILLSDGTLLSSGQNEYGQLGLGHEEDQKTFQRITIPPELLLLLAAAKDEDYCDCDDIDREEKKNSNHHSQSATSNSSPF